MRANKIRYKFHELIIVKLHAITLFKKRSDFKGMKIISKQDFSEFVNLLIKDGSWNVVGVKSKGSKYAFGPLESADELRLDYDITLLPPKKYFFPQRETLFSFDVATGVFTEASTVVKPKVIVGVSPYDLVALLH